MPGQPEAPQRRWWRWDQFAVLGAVLLACAAYGGRPGLARQQLEAVLIAVRVHRAASLPSTTRVELAATAAELEALLRYRRDDRRYQSALGWEVVRRNVAAGRLPRARAVADDLLRRHGAPVEPRAATALHWLLWTEGRPREAIAVLENLLRLGGSDAALSEVRSALAAAYDDLGWSAAAEPLYWALYRADPGSAWHNNDLAYHYAQTGRHLEQAERLARRAVATQRRRLAERLTGRHDQVLGNYLDTLGWVYYRQDRLKDAEPVLREAVRLTGEDEPTVLAHLAQVCYDRGNDVEAARLVDRALQVDPHHDAAQHLKELLAGGPRLPGEIG